MYYHCPGRTCTLVNDRLRRKTEIYGGRAQLPYTMCVYGAIRWETDSVYGDRTKIRTDLKINICAPYTELYDCRIWSYITVRDRIRSYTATVTVQFNEQHVLCSSHIFFEENSEYTFKCEVFRLLFPSPIRDLSRHYQRLKVKDRWTKKFYHSNRHITSIRLLSHDSLATEKRRWTVTNTDKIVPEYFKAFFDI